MRRVYRQGGKCGRHVYIGPFEEDEVLVAVGDVPTAREEARRVVERMNEPSAFTAVRTWTVLIRDSFAEFRPTIDGAIQALNELLDALGDEWEATHGAVWSNLMRKIEKTLGDDPEMTGK